MTLLSARCWRTRCRTFGASELVAVDAAESALVLKGLASAPWTGDQSLLGFRAFHQLGVTEKDGWKAPAGQPGEDYPTTTYKAFLKWLDGPGKDFRVKKFVPKK